MKILIVDDTPINLRLLRRQLETVGHTVFAARDGVEALALLEHQCVDAIICDILMPRMDGYRLCYEVRRNAQIRSIHFVLYSSTDTSPADEKLGREVGADAFISKFDGAERILALFQDFCPRPLGESSVGADGSRDVEVIKRYSEHFLARMEEHVAELRLRTVEMEREIAERQSAQERIERSRLALLSALEDQKLADDSRRKAMAETERHLALLETCFDTLAEGVIICDMEGNVVSWNRAAVAMHGFASLDKCCRRVSEFQDTFEISAQDGALVSLDQWPFPRILRGETLRGWEVLIRREQADWERWLSYSGSLARDKAGRPLLGVLSVADVTERRKTEASLRLFRAQIERANDAIEVVDPNTGRFLDMNEKGCQELGYTREEILSLAVMDIDPTLNFAGFSAVMEKLAQTSSARFETTHRRKDGSTFPVEVSINRIFMDRDYVVAVARDITARKEAEEKARSSEELFGKAFRASPAAMLFSSLADGRLIEANDAFLRMFGFESREQIIGRTGLELGVWDDPADRERISQAIQKSGSLRGVEAAFRRRSGERGHALASIELVELHGKRCVLSLFHDITARKRAEADLQRSLSLLSATLESTDDGILALDIEGKVVSFNQRFVDLWRIPAEVIASHDHHRVLALAIEQLQDPGAFLNQAPDLDARDEPTGSDTLQFKDGRVFERYSHPQRIDGQTVGRVWSFRDVTERRRLEGQLRQVQKMESVGQLAAGIAHDFNNLLTVIQCYGDLLRTQIADRPQAADCVNEIAAAGERAANLTRQLLLFSRKEVARRRLLDLNDLTGNLVKMLGRILGEDIALRLECHPSLPPVHADPGMIEQVITNLSVNARDAMPEGGRLEITTSVADLDSASVLSNPEARPGRFVCLAVRDTGSGIAPEIVSKIFEPFFTTKEVGKGTGLGLATVYGIVMQHQGVVEVASRPGNGACFCVFLPAAAPAEEAATGASAPEPARGGSETVLLVEDEAVVLFLVEKILTRAGYTVLIATSGPAAQEVWQNHREKIDMLLTDMVMPGGFSGKQLAENLKAKKTGLRVIFMSGYSPDLRSRDLEIKEGLNFLQKPFSPAALLQAVRRQFDSGA